jgi:hypothetical protein
MTASAVYGFIGVLLGSLTTAALTVYRERLLGKREREARDHRREQGREDRRNAFQRERLLALQDALSDLLKAVFKELAQHIKLKPPVNQWLLRTGTSCPVLFRAVVIRRWHD